ncbi:MAG: DUF4405 domain-containing protein [Chloroflexota bacterium]
MTVKPRTNLALDAVILLLFVVTFVSGVLLWVVYPPGGGQRVGTGRGAVAASADEMTLLGLNRHTMGEAHDWAGVIMGVLVLVHLVFHWKWIVCQVRRLWGGPRPARAPRDTCPEA